MPEPDPERRCLHCGHLLTEHRPMSATGGCKAPGCHCPYPNPGLT